MVEWNLVRNGRRKHLRHIIEIVERKTKEFTNDFLAENPRSISVGSMLIREDEVG
jgi:hypothetical protein